MRRQHAQPQPSAITRRTARRAWPNAQGTRHIGFLAIILFSMTVLSGLHATPSSAAPKEDVTKSKEDVTQLDISPKSLNRRLKALEAALSTLQTTVAAQNTKIADLEETVSDQQTEIEAHKAKLAPVSMSGTVFTISGVNVRIVDGSGSTASTSGLGNLAIGYNEERIGENVINTRTGSHNLILGTQNNYSSSGGLVAGRRNEISGLFATISGGSSNEAEGDYSSVSGGEFNEASGKSSSVSGGFFNSASADGASVSGGYQNRASGSYSSIGGGFKNAALATWSVVSGGRERTAFGSAQWRAGSLIEDL